MKNLRVTRIALAAAVLATFSFVWLDVWFYHLVLVTEPDNREIWATITDLGDSGWMLLGSLAVWIVGLALSKFVANDAKWKYVSSNALFVFSAVAIPRIFSMVFKGVIGRARPYLFDTEGPRSFDFLAFEANFASFPSGHTTTAFAMAAAVTLIFPRAAFYVIPLAVVAGYSRMALGAHYLSDVIMGATVGTLGAVLVYRWLAPKLKL